MILIREDIPTELLLMDKSNESHYIETHLRRVKWLSKTLDLYSCKFEKILALGDFNVTLEEPTLKTFSFLVFVLVFCFVF